MNPETDTGPRFAPPDGSSLPAGTLRFEARDAPRGSELRLLHEDETPLSVVIENLGPGVAAATLGVGRYLWAFDVSGRRTREHRTPVAHLTIVPQVDAWPREARTVVVVQEPGWGFSPGGVACLFFQRPVRDTGAPGGSVYRAVAERIDATGRYRHTWPAHAQAQVGTFRYWAYDAATGIRSNVVSFHVRH